MIKLTIAATLAIAGLLLFCGLYLFFKGARNVARAIASTKWPVAEGIVVSSETTRTVGPTYRRQPASVSFSTRTVIRYSVAGKEYTTDVLHFGQTLGSSDKSEAALQKVRYPAEKAVSVAYDPGAPWVGVMKPGLHPEAFWLIGASLALLIPVAAGLSIGPGLLRDTAAREKAFQESVEKAIDEGQHGRMPDVPIPSPAGGDKTMAVVAAIGGAVFCGLGILALTAGVQRMWHGNASLSWPTTSGVVIAASKGNGENDEDVNDSTDSAWYARFVYRYKVAGVDHFNNVRRFAQVEGGGGREEIDRIASRYRKGATVKVSYFPTDPDVAVLEPGNTSAALWLPGIGLVLILFSAAVFIWMVPAMAR
jgi:hypothetical protein